MRQLTLSISWAALSICALVLSVAAAAQDNPTTPADLPQEPAIGNPAETQDQTTGRVKTFEQIVAEVRANEKMINKLFGTIPIGFPKQQAEYLARIEALKQANRTLKDQMDVAAMESFRRNPGKSRLAAQLVFNSLVRKLESTRETQAFDPVGALEIAETMLATDLDNQPNSPVRLEDVAYQAFLASFAIGDFDRADLMLQRIEQKGVSLLPAVRADLSDAKAKWERELMIRRLESNSDDLPRVKLETSEGDIVVELFENHAPQTVGNFISLVEKNFYNELPFFLVQPGQIAQTGCPIGDGTGDPGYKIPCECYEEEIRHHFTGTLSMSNVGRDTGGSQFFITYQRNGKFDGRFTAFGRIIEGMDVLFKLKATEEIQTVGLDGSDPPPSSSILKATVIRKRNHPYVPTRVAENPDTNSVDPIREQPLETVESQNSGG